MTASCWDWALMGKWCHFRTCVNLLELLQLLLELLQFL